MTDADRTGRGGGFWLDRARRAGHPIGRQTIELLDQRAKLGRITRRILRATNAGRTPRKQDLNAIEDIKDRIRQLEAQRDG